MSVELPDPSYRSGNQGTKPLEAERLLHYHNLRSRPICTDICSSAEQNNFIRHLGSMAPCPLYPPVSDGSNDDDDDNNNNNDGKHCTADHSAKYVNRMPGVTVTNKQLNRAMTARYGVVQRSVGNVRRRLTGVLIDYTRTLFTGDSTTPAEFTVTFLHSLHPCRVVATPTTHDVTAVRPQR